MKKRLIALLTAAIMLLTPALALAETLIDIDVGSVTIDESSYIYDSDPTSSHTHDGAPVVYSLGNATGGTTSNTVTILTDSSGGAVDVAIKDVDFSGSSGDSFIRIVGDGKAQVELNDVTVTGGDQAIYISPSGTGTAEVELAMEDVDISVSGGAQAVVANGAEVDIDVSGDNSITAQDGSALALNNGSSVTVTGDSAGDALNLTSGSSDGTVTGNGDAMLTVTGEATVTVTNTVDAEPVQNVTVNGETQTTTSGTTKTTTITAPAEPQDPSDDPQDPSEDPQDPSDDPQDPPADPPAYPPIVIPTLDELKAMGQEEIEALTEEQMGALTEEHIEALSADQLGWLSSAQVQALTATQIGWLTETQIGWLTETTISYLTLDQINALTEEQKAAMSEAQRTALETRYTQLTTPAYANLETFCGDSNCLTSGCTGPLDERHLKTTAANFAAGTQSLSLSDQGMRVPTNIPVKPGLTMNGIAFFPDVGQSGNALIGLKDLQAARTGQVLIENIDGLNADDLIIFGSKLFVDRTDQGPIVNVDPGHSLLTDPEGSERLDIGWFQLYFKCFIGAHPNASSALASLEGKEFVSVNVIGENGKLLEPWRQGFKTPEQPGQLEEYFPDLLDSKNLIGQSFELAVDGTPLGSATVNNIYPDKQVPFFDPDYANCPPNQACICGMCKGSGQIEDALGDRMCPQCGGTGTV